MTRRRPLVVLAVVVAAAVIAGVAIYFGSVSGSSNSSAPSSGATTQASGGGSHTAPEGPLAVLAGVPQRGDTLGRESAPATLNVFEDPQCPYCQQWALETFPTAVADYVKTGKVKLVYQGVQIIGPNSEPALRAIYAAGRQNKLWNLVEKLYTEQGKENSGWVTTPLLRQAARAVGADPDAMMAASGSPAVTARMKAAEAAFRAANAQGTPSFVVEQPPALPQALQLSGLDPASFTAALDAALQ